MSKKGKRRIKPTDGAVSKADKQTQPGMPIRQGNYRSYALWSLSGLIVIMAGILAWTTLGKSSPDAPKIASANQSPTATPNAKPTATRPAKSESDTTNVSGGPKINFPEKSYDFRTIAQGSKVSHTFKVRNVGDAPLRLIKAAGS